MIRAAGLSMWKMSATYALRAPTKIRKGKTARSARKASSAESPAMSCFDTLRATRRARRYVPLRWTLAFVRMSDCMSRKAIDGRACRISRYQLLRCGSVKPQFGQDAAPTGGNGFWHLGQAVERRMPQWAQNCQFGETSCWHA